MGVVVRARAPDGRVVALKQLLGLEPEACARFQRECRLLADLGAGEGFVPLLGAGAATEGPFIVLPLPAPGTLRERLGPPLPVAQVPALGVALAGALER